MSKAYKVLAFYKTLLLLICLYKILWKNL